MTVGALIKRLKPYDEKLEVWIRCSWEGESPSSNVFRVDSIVQDMDHDTAEDFVAIECDQSEEK